MVETDHGTKRILTIFLHQFYCQLWPSKEETKLSYKYQVIILTGRTKCPMHRATSDGKGATCRSVSSRCGVLASKANPTVILDILQLKNGVVERIVQSVLELGGGATI